MIDLKSLILAPDADRINALIAENVKQKYTLATFDIETDPFKYGRIPRPFSCSLYFKDGDSEIIETFWGDNCIELFLMYVKNSEKKFRIYAHNGGKFDFMFLLYHGVLSGGEKSITIINGRITKCQLFQHELRDSYAIIPLALSKFSKYEIDYDKMERENREQNKVEIVKYLEQDCRALYIVVEAFIKKFGTKLTIGSAAINECKKFHPFSKLPQHVGDVYDPIVRKYYFGGRVECFETGILTGDFKVFDVNSMYPAVMRNVDHCISPLEIITKNFDDLIDRKTGTRLDADLPYFIHFTGANKNALPTRAKSGLNFGVEYGEFFASSHEIKIALKYDLIRIDTIHEMLISEDSIRFEKFVDTYTREKIAGKKSGDKLQETFAKLIMNSSYGKFATNPANFKDFIIASKDDILSGAIDMTDLIEKNYEPCTFYDSTVIFEKPSDEYEYFDVAVGASITGAARAVLLEAIIKADRPVYCDTDSIICENLSGVKLDPFELGAWDCEGRGNLLAVYAKKMYALMDGETCTKSASKGVQLNHTDLFKLAKGETVSHKNIAPSLKLKSRPEFVERIIGAEKHTKLYDKYGAKKVATK